MISTIFALCLVAVIAIPPPTPYEFVYPKNGDSFTLNTKQNITYDPARFPSVAAVQVKLDFGSDAIQNIIEKTPLNDIQNQCFPLSEQVGDSLPIDLTIPVGAIQDLIDSLDLPFHVDVRWLVNNALAQVTNIPEAERNVTISLLECEATEPTFQSWVIVSSARAVCASLAAVTLSLLALL